MSRSALTTQRVDVGACAFMAPACSQDILVFFLSPIKIQPMQCSAGGHEAVCLREEDLVVALICCIGRCTFTGTRRWSLLWRTVTLCCCARGSCPCVR